MIQQAIDIICKALAKGGFETTPPIARNIAELIADPGADNTQAVIVSLINIEENRVSRDPRNYLRPAPGSGNSVILKNPAVHLNLTLLFTSVRSGQGYENALMDIQKVIGFFQQKMVFDASNTDPFPAPIEKLIVEMLSLNLEQLHQLWSMLGGKYYPSVAYKVRMVTIDSIKPETGEVITEIETKYYV
ncbi:MAG: DUF4255 domain-containing protein [Chitinophagaceae bacterium]|nr:DUF4255 domain-containing protein [Chitinophagaceae bacterium]